MTKTYAIGIPTRGRRAILGQTILAMLRQTLPPSLILLVNNNDSDELKVGGITEEEMKEAITKDVIIQMVQCDYDTPGIIHGDQTALRIFKEQGYKIAARWDDDLVPEPDCMEKLVYLMCRGYIGAGGMYPGVNNTSPEMGSGYSHMEEDGPVGANSSHKHLQFWAWKGKHRIIERHFLYSSFVYNVEAANAIGGFCTEYSQHSYRADTDFTLRLNQKGKHDYLLSEIGKKTFENEQLDRGGWLAVDTSAVAVHKWCAGGIRGIREDDAYEMKMHDVNLFNKRMKALGIDPDY